MPKRGIREATRTAGPTLSFAHQREDVGRYTDAADACPGESRAGR